MKNKVVLGYFAVFIVLIVCLSIAITKSPRPDNELIGVWEETSWRYAKSPQRSMKKLTEDKKEEITENLIIHKAETWEFLPGGKALLHRTKDTINTEALTWTLKGRGHILKLDHKKAGSEYYQLFHISEKEMVLHFHTELQAKGIVKMTFKKKI